MGVSKLRLKKQPYYLIAFRILLVLVWTQETVLRFFKAIFERLPIIGGLSDVIIPIAIIAALIVSLPWFFRKLKGTDLLFYLFMVVLVLGTMAIYDNNASYLREEWWRILVASATFYFLGVAHSHRACSRDLFWCSAIGVAAVFLYQIYKLSRGRVLEEDDMNTAYNLLPSVMYLFYYASYKKKRILWCIAGGATAVMFVFGTRGPIVCIIVYLCALIMNNTLRSQRKGRKILVGILLLGVILLFSNESVFIAISHFMSGIFRMVGFSTRIFDFFLAGEITVSKGRDILQEQIIYYIKENPIVGYGFTGDRHLIGVYCHNLVLELWSHFGVIAGSLVLLALFTLTIIALIKCSKNEKVFKFALMLACLVFAKLMMSNSYAIEPYFFFMIGAYVGILRKFVKRKPKKEEDL